MLKKGDTYLEDFVVSQEQVNQFSQLSGDKNPLHLDAKYAANTAFKSPIVHGMYSASMISKVLGMKFPGEGTLYLTQELAFKRPVYPGRIYSVKCEIIETEEGKHTATIETQIFDKEKNKIVLDGLATVRHLTMLP